MQQLQPEREGLLVLNATPAGSKSQASSSTGQPLLRPVKRGSKRQQDERFQQQQRQQGQNQESRSFRRALKFIESPLPIVTDPNHPDYGATNKGQKQQHLQDLQQQYGPHFADSDVRLYIKKHELNAARRKPSRRGGFPLDDSFDKPGTFLKLSVDFQRTIMNERCSELTGVVSQLTLTDAWQLYTTIPGLLTLTTLQVAQRLHGLAYSTGLSLAELVQYLCQFRRLAFIAPVTVESRVGLLAKVARLERKSAVRLMMQQPALWLISSKLLGPRAEQLALLLSCCTITALKLLGICPQLLATPLPALQQQHTKLCVLFSCSAVPAILVPLLLLQPSLLLQHNNSLQQQDSHGNGHTASNAAQAGQPAVNIVQSQLQRLAAVLQLPDHLLHHMVLRAPDVLGLAASGSNSNSLIQTSSNSVQNGNAGGTTATTAAATAAAAVAGAGAAGCAASIAVQALSKSWLCSEEAATARQQYQQQLGLLLQGDSNQHYQQKRRHRHRHCGLPQPAQQQQQHPWSDKYIAAAAPVYAVLSSQWWSSSNDHTQLPAPQQVVLQAPALLALAAPQAAASSMAAAQHQVAGPGQTSGAQALSNVNVQRSWQPLDAVSGLDVRLQALAEELAFLLTPQEAQQLQQPLGEASDTQEQPASVSVLQQLKYAAVLEPGLLALPPRIVASQLQQLCKVLCLTPAALWQLLHHCPAVLWLTEGQLFERVRVLSGMLKVSAAKVRHTLLASDGSNMPVLLLEPCAVRKTFAKVAAELKASGTGDSQVRQAVLEGLNLLLPGQLIGRS